MEGTTITIGVVRSFSKCGHRFYCGETGRLSLIPNLVNKLVVGNKTAYNVPLGFLIEIRSDLKKRSKVKPHKKKLK